MGATNKLLLQAKGVSVVRRAAAVLCSCGFDEVIAVTGHENSPIREALAGLPLRTVFNENYRLGQRGSVLAGVGCLSPSSESVLVGLADQPWLTKADVLAVCEAFGHRTRGQVLIPRVGKQRGNPVAMTKPFAMELVDLQQRGRLQPGPLVRADHPEAVFWDSPNEHYVMDVDWPEDCGKAGLEVGPPESRSGAQ